VTSWAATASAYPKISWPNSHSSANGDYQPVLTDEAVHEFSLHHRDIDGRIEWFPAHPHEGSVRADSPHAVVLAQGRSTATGRPSFVTEPPGTQIQSDPWRLQIFKDYIRNIAGWLGTHKGAQ
jgi:hypothetical protein